MNEQDGKLRPLLLIKRFLEERKSSHASSICVERCDHAWHPKTNHAAARVTYAENFERDDYEPDRTLDQVPNAIRKLFWPDAEGRSVPGGWNNAKQI